MSSEMHFPARFRKAAYGLFSTVTFAAITLPTIGLVAIVPGEKNRRRIVKVAAGLVFRLIGAWPRVTGLDNLPDAACILASNHASYIDGILLTAVLPPRFSFVIKREMTQVPLAHFLLRRIGSEFVDRSDSHRSGRDARRILHQATQQQSLAFFPEGTFGEKPGLQRFHSGAFAAAVRGQCPVVPIVIRGSRRMLSSKDWLPGPSRLEVIIKPPIPCPAEGNAAKEMLQACRQSILEDLNEPDIAA
jgi:1-acyl-sn-glycerol-3-phosphate acyltransferase